MKQYRNSTLRSLGRRAPTYDYWVKAFVCYSDLFCSVFSVVSQSGLSLSYRRQTNWCWSVSGVMLIWSGYDVDNSNLILYPKNTSCVSSTSWSYQTRSMGVRSTPTPLIIIITIIIIIIIDISHFLLATFALQFWRQPLYRRQNWRTSDLPANPWLSKIIVKPYPVSSQKMIICRIV